MSAASPPAGTAAIWALSEMSTTPTASPRSSRMARLRPREIACSGSASRGIDDEPWAIAWVQAVRADFVLFEIPGLKPIDIALQSIAPCNQLRTVRERLTEGGPPKVPLLLRKGTQDHCAGEGHVLMLRCDGYPLELRICAAEARFLAGADNS